MSYDNKMLKDLLNGRPNKSLRESGDQRSVGLDTADQVPSSTTARTTTSAVVDQRPSSTTDISSSSSSGDNITLIGLLNEGPWVEPCPQLVNHLRSLPAGPVSDQARQYGPTRGPGPDLVSQFVPTRYPGPDHFLQYGPTRGPAGAIKRSLSADDSGPAVKLATPTLERLLAQPAVIRHQIIRLTSLPESSIPVFL